MFNRMTRLVRPSRRSRMRINESEPEKRANRIYQILLIFSLVLNGVLALRSQWNTERVRNLNDEKMQLDVKKTELENQLLLAKNLPTFSFFRLRYELGTFYSQLKQGKLLPFLSKVEDYRIIQNELLDSVELRLKTHSDRYEARQTITFLVVMNVSTAPAYSIRVEISNIPSIEVGDLMPGAVLLFPTEYEIERQNPVKRSIVISSLHYEVMSGTDRKPYHIIVPPAVAQSWVPILENIRGIGRALTIDEPDHLKKVLPKSR